MPGICKSVANTQLTQSDSPPLQPSTILTALSATHISHFLADLVILRPASDNSELSHILHLPRQRPVDIQPTFLRVRRFTNLLEPLSPSCFDTCLRHKRAAFPATPVVPRTRAHTAHPLSCDHRVSFGFESCAQSSTRAARSLLEWPPLLPFLPPWARHTKLDSLVFSSSSASCVPYKTRPRISSRPLLYLTTGPISKTVRPP